MSLLNRDLAKRVYVAFKGKLLRGLIRQTITPESGGLDADGDPIDVVPVFTKLEGFFDEYDDLYRARAGIPEKDVLVNIFAESIPAITPGKDDKVMLKGRDGEVWYQLRKAKVDPATALWACQSFIIPAPDDAP